MLLLARQRPGGSDRGTRLFLTDILSKAGIVPADAVLDQKSLAQVRMPNRNGFIPDPRPEEFGKAQ
jgi:hypothetical protein